MELLGDVRFDRVDEECGTPDSDEIEDVTALDGFRLTKERFGEREIDAEREAGGTPAIRP